MNSKLKTYRNPKDGYTIKATEKAYNLFYKKQGFVEVKKEEYKSVDATSDTSTDVESSGTEPVEADAEPTENAVHEENVKNGKKAAKKASAE